MILRIFITWFLFLPVPIINGLLREKWYKTIIGNPASHQVGAVIISVIFLMYAYVCLKGNVLSLSNWQLWHIGLFWLILTLLFEFGIGIASGRSWKYMLSDYKIWQGRIWLLVLIVVLTSPFIIKWFIKN